jgi:hypothetical protein
MWLTLGKLLLCAVVLFICIKILDYRSPLFLLSFAVLYVEFLLYEIALVRELNHWSRRFDMDLRKN